MIIPIIIDGSALQQQFALSGDQIESICDNIAKTLAAGYAQQLEQEANNALSSTRRRYIQNVHVVDSGRMEGMVILDYSKDPLIKMLEEGASSFDIKDGLLGSPKVKIGRNGGRYITVPMRWGTPDAVGESDVFTGILPQVVYEAVQAKPATIPVSGGGMRSSGLSAGEIPSPFSAVGSRAPIADSAGKILFEEYKHKTSVYQGVSKKTDPSTGQNTYNSFRRVSDKSDSNAFIHPGIEQYNLIQRALENFDQVQAVSLALDQELINLGF
jgi:hypothetical protein